MLPLNARAQWDLAGLCGSQESTQKPASTGHMATWRVLCLSTRSLLRIWDPWAPNLATSVLHHLSLPRMRPHGTVGDCGEEVAEAGGQVCNVSSPSEAVCPLEDVLLGQVPYWSRRVWCKQQLGRLSLLGWCLPPLVQEGKESRTGRAAAWSSLSCRSAQSLLPSKYTKACSTATSKKHL